MLSKYPYYYSNNSKTKSLKERLVIHFLPRQNSGKRATLLSLNALIVYCLVMFLFVGILGIIPKLLPGVLGYASDINLNDLFIDINLIRSEYGLPVLRLNEELSKAAEKKAEDMFKNNYWAHVSPSGKEPWDFILAQNYDYSFAGENLAKNFSTSKDVVNAWYDSLSHRENLLNKNYDEVGYGIKNGVLDGYETTLVVQMFGRPRNAGSIATLEEEKRILKNSASSSLAGVSSEVASFGPESRVSHSFNFSSATKTINVSFILFVMLLLLADVWYSKKKSILKFNGHTFAHLTFLFIVLLGVWFVLRPGIIL